MNYIPRNGSANRIDWFDDFVGENEYRFLSNFYVGKPLSFDGYDFQTGEHMFAAFKADTRKMFEKIAFADDPNEAKYIGRKCILRRDWSAIKYDVMRVVLATKFTDNRDEGRLLRLTGHKMLVEGTDWNDKVWGVNRGTGKGRNWLGSLLMARRAELVAERYGAEIFDYTQAKIFIRPLWMWWDK